MELAYMSADEIDTRDREPLESGCKNFRQTFIGRSVKLRLPLLRFLVSQSQQNPLSFKIL